MKKIYVKPSMNMMSIDSQAMLAGSGTTYVDVVLRTNESGLVEVNEGTADSKEHHGSSVWDD